MHYHRTVFVFLALILFTKLASSQTLGFSTAFIAEGHLIIAPDSSYDTFMSAEAAKKKSMWFSDQYQQPWVLSRPKVSGNNNVLLIRVREQASPDGYSPCKVETGPSGYVERIENCSMPIAGFDFFQRTVLETPVFQWSCNDTWLPALYLGDAPEGDNGYEGMRLFAFLSKEKLPLPTVKRITPELPESIEQQFAIGYDAWSFDFGDGVERWLIYFSDFHAGPYYWVIENPREENKRKVREARTLVGRC